MAVDIEIDNLPPFPTRLNEKLKAIRLRLNLSPDEFAPLVGVASGAAIECYERELGDELRPLLVTTLWRYTKLAGVPIENLWDDGRDQLDTIPDVPKGSVPSGSNPQPLWRDWMEKVDYDPWRRPCMGHLPQNRC